MLKYKIKKLEDVEEQYRPFYKEQDGVFVLQVEGATDKARLDEFRTNNITLREQMDAMKAQFEGLDPEEARKALEERQKLRDKKLLEAGKVDELLAERTAAMKAEYEKQIGKLTKELTGATGQLERLLIDNAIQTESAKAGVRTTALEDVLLRGRARFKLQDGKAVPVDQDGKVIFGKDGTNPQSISEWLADLAPAAPHLFEASTGGGAKPGPTGQAGQKQMKRKDWEAKDPASKSAFLKEGGVLVD